MQLIMYFESNNNNNIQTLLERGFYSFNISYITNNIQSLIEHKHDTLINLINNQIESSLQRGNYAFYTSKIKNIRSFLRYFIIVSFRSTINHIRSLFAHANDALINSINNKIESPSRSGNYAFLDVLFGHDCSGNSIGLNIKSSIYNIIINYTFNNKMNVIDILDHLQLNIIFMIMKYIINYICYYYNLILKLIN